ncbi:Gamma-tubulin complex component 6 [Gracilariopsis chorda]|uniref:Spindle pole body component n=1 Tax=Gracilariopsis chorda TaxID=448386 RepID=A0A2V3IM06_9FLOR|nr:Gamma-tubulin complex component 6 [Gracilariopsis chorda]|eukprot:PXF43115.1 Gamma-tubulin complex component 6 [Gracilariopsis chorda]
MVQKEDRGSSILQLTKKLWKEKWILGYEVLLDITGEFRKHHIRTNAECESLLFDVTTELRAAGRVDDANQLEVLAKPVTGESGSSSESVLLVLLLCAQNLRRKPRTVPGLLFSSDSFVNTRKATPSSDNRPNGFFDISISEIFNESGGTGDTIPGSSKSHSLSSSNSTYDFEDCLAARARSAIEQKALWLENKMRPSPLALTSKSKISNQPTSVYDLDQWKAFRPLEKEHVSYVPTPTDASLLSTASRDERILQHVFCRCVSGPEFDELVVHSDDDYQLNKLQAVLLGSQQLSEETKKNLLGRTDTTRQRRWAHQLLTKVRAPQDEVTELTIRSSVCGALYQDILSFSNVYASLDLGRSLQAVITFIEEKTESYYFSLLDSVQDHTVLPRNKPWSLLNKAESMISDMYHLGELLSMLETTDGSSFSVLTVLKEHASKQTCSSTLNQMFLNVFMTYMDFVWDWFFEASCRRDSKHEFFGTMLGLSARGSESLRSGDIIQGEDGLDTPRQESELIHGLFPSIFSEDQALFILRAGRSRSLLQYFGLETGNLANKPQLPSGSHCRNNLNLLRARLDEYVQCLKSPGSPTEQHPTISEPDLNTSHGLKAMGAPVDDKDDPLSKTLSTDCESFVVENHPHEAQDSLIQKSLYVADTLSTIPLAFQMIMVESEDDDNAFQGDIEFQSCFTWNQILPMSSQSQDLTDPYCPPLSLVSRGFLLQPLRVIDELVQTKVMRSFVQDLDLFGHLKNLRSHILLGAGDFANALVGQIEGAARTSEATERYIQRRVNAAMTFYGTSGAGGRYLRDRTLLNRCLRTALNLYSRVHNPYADLLFMDSVSHVDERESASGKISLWDHSMEFKYHVEFPLNIIFSEEAMAMYSKISDFFLRVLRAKQSLRSLFVLSRRNSSLYKRSEERLSHNKRLQVAIWNFSWQAEHFVSIFGGFEMDQVLGTAWDKFKSSWENTDNIWDLRDAHMRFLNVSVRRCLLGEKHKSVLSVMSGGFDIVVKIDKQIISVCYPDMISAPVETENVIDLLISASASLKRRSMFLTDVLGRLIESGGFPHLEDLLTRLNFNYFYQASAS